MKKIILAFSLLFSITAIAQPDNRVFTVLTGQIYSNVNQMNATKIDTAGWDDFSAAFPIGFTFKLSSQNVDSIYFDKSINAGADMYFKKNAYSTMLGFGFTDFTDRSSDGNHNESTIYYTVLNGTNKTGILEWRDAGFYQDTTLNDSVNFQVWFVQNTNEIQVHFGPSGLHVPTSKLFTRSNGNYALNKPFFGFLRNWDPQNQVFDSAYYVKSVSPAVFDSTSIDSMYVSTKLGFTSWPSNGTVFKFTPAPVGILGVQLNNYTSVFPTAFIDRVFVNIDKSSFDGTLSLVDLNGKLVLQQKAIDGNNVLQTNNLSAGIYILNIKTENESVFYKLIKN